ncbi:hypothetical protein [Frondihabitans cladoniiphilus]|uniref:hypothetical protein n=1 Tax=Frondihabitans cladoniiphilus TaxID=715785 RepID=UPI0031ED8A43
MTGPAGHFLPGKVVAEIMFGFWTFMTAGSHEDLVWTPYLRHAFPPGTDRNRLHETLSALRDFRNRVAHHEPILGAPESQRRRIVFVARLLSPDVAAHIVEHSDVPDLLRRKP